MNDVRRSLEEAVTSGGAALRALGGAIQVRGTEAALRTTGSSFIACAAQHTSTLSNYGGAIYAVAMVNIKTTRFEANYVQGATDAAEGGALYCEARRLQITDSEFIANKAVGLFQSYGGAISMIDCAAFMSVVTGRLPDFCNVTSESDCGAQLRAVTFERNVASGASSRAKGGGLYADTPLLCVSISDSKLVQNVARDTAGNAEGGALIAYGRSRIKITSSRFVGNAAQNAQGFCRSVVPNASFLSLEWKACHSAHT
jgi:hypothetical protein